MTILLARLLNVRPRHGFLLVGAAACCVLIGGLVYAATEHIPVTSGWYWAVETATTVGYGDVNPTNGAGRVVAIVVMLTTIPLLAAAFALLTGSAVANGVRRLLEVGARFPEGSYRLVLGWHPAIPVVLEELAHAGDSVVLVADVEPSVVPGHVHFVRGNPTSEADLEAGRPAGAAHVLIASDEDGDVLLTAVLVHEVAPGVPVTALVSSRRLLRALRDLGVDQVLSPDDLTGHTIAKGLEAPHAGELLMDLVRGEQHRLAEHVIAADAESQPLSALRMARPELILGVVHAGTVSLGVSDDPPVGPGDILLVVEPNGTHAARGQRREHAEAVE